MRLLAGLVACLAAAVAAVAEAAGPPGWGAATASPPPVAAEEPWVSASGSGLLSLPDTSTLAKKHLDVGLAFDNQDRDPTRLDVAEFGVAWNYGLRSDAETYGHVVVSRGVIVADRPTLFPPPVDIVLPAGSPVPRRPYYPLYAPFPYVNRSGSSWLGRFMPGDVVLGGKVRLVAPARWRPALAATLELKLPTAKDLSSLQSGAGTGGVDETLRLTGEWRRQRQSLVASIGLTHVGRPAVGDRVIVVQPEGGVNRTDMPVRLANRLHLGLGFRHVLKPSAALVAEVTKVVSFGGRTAALEASGPLDLTAGGQFRWRRVHLTLGVRYHANSVPAFETHPSPMGGMTDLTSVEPGARNAYLTAIGVGASVPYIRDRSQIAAFAPADGPPLPKGALVLPPVFTVRSHDRIASMLVLGWSFGRGPGK